MSSVVECKTLTQVTSVIAEPLSEYARLMNSGPVPTAPQVF